MKCNTPIDPETEVALSGEALEAALKNPTSPRCRQELVSDDVFCPACGARVENHFLSQDEALSCDSDSVPIGVVAWLKNLCKGRAARRRLWRVTLMITLCYALAGAALLQIETSKFDQILTVMSFIAGVCTVPVVVRRLHDLEFTGKVIIPSVCFSVVLTVLSLSGNDANPVGWFVGIIATVYNFYLFVFLGFAKGTQGPNKYGPDPCASADVPVGSHAGQTLKHKSCSNSRRDSIA